MDLLALYGILADTTELFRHDSVVEGAAGAQTFVRASTGDVEPTSLRHISLADGRLEMVPLCFVTAGVWREEALKHEKAVLELLDRYPDPLRMAEGPSYIEVGSVLDSRDAALRLFALGRVLGFWSIFTPSAFGMTGKEAERAARDGFVTISGWQGALDARLRFPAGLNS